MALALLARTAWKAAATDDADGRDFVRTAPTFTFRTMDHLKAAVYVNGVLVSDTVCLWGYSPSYPFDPDIPVPVWPPPGAAFIASARQRDPDGGPSSTVQMALAGGVHDAGLEALRKEFPHLEHADQVLYVQAVIGDTRYQGALRLRVVAPDGTVYRHTAFNPVQSEEAENASLFTRSLWFQREIAR